MNYFTREELTKNRDKDYPLNAEQETNLAELTRALNLVREAYGKPLSVSSCYRPAAINASVGGAKHSAHMMCQAADIVDNDGKFAEWVMNNLDFLKSCGILSIEDTRYTQKWVHLSTRPVKSGKLVFIP